MPKMVESTEEKQEKQEKPKPLKPLKELKLADRPVLYPEPGSKMCLGPDALKSDDAKAFLDWTVVEVGDHDFVDQEGNKIVCLNNRSNRPFRKQVAMFLAQELLNKRWKANGEALCIGRTGLTISCQHRLIGLIFAEQMRQRDMEHWRKLWPTEVVLETWVSVGIDESPETLRTLDNVLTRTFGDVLFADGKFFGKESKSNRVKITRMADYAIRLLWDRTGANKDPYCPRRTHSEALEFLDRHDKVRASVRHIFDEENGSERKISRLGISLGTASGMLYLMGTGKTDYHAYHNMAVKSERKVDFELWSKATDFWTLLAGSEELEFRVLRDALLIVSGESGTPEQRKAIVSKAWHQYAGGQKISPQSLDLEYFGDGEDRQLINVPSLGGIDTYQCPEPEAPPTLEEIEAGKEAERSAKAAKLLEKRAAKKAEMAGRIDANHGPKSLMTRKEREAEQTRKAREADEAMEEDDDEEEEDEEPEPYFPRKEMEVLGDREE